VDVGCRPRKEKTTQVTSEASVWDSRADTKSDRDNLRFQAFEKEEICFCYLICDSPRHTFGSES
jgi:hypothetical protein